MSDLFYTVTNSFLGAFEGGYPIVLSDTIPLTTTTRGIYVGTAGNITMRFGPTQTSVTFTAVPAGTVLNVRADLVNLTGTTASNLVALF